MGLGFLGFGVFRVLAFSTRVVTLPPRVSSGYPPVTRDCQAVPTTTTADASETSMAPSVFMSAALSAAFLASAFLESEF